MPRCLDTHKNYDQMITSLFLIIMTEIIKIVDLFRIIMLKCEDSDDSEHLDYPDQSERKCFFIELELQLVKD